jgi:hypothetical protein
MPTEKARAMEETSAHLMGFRIRGKGLADDIGENFEKSSVPGRVKKRRPG